MGDRLRGISCVDDRLFIGGTHTGQHQVEQEQWCCDKPKLCEFKSRGGKSENNLPVDVSNIEDFAVSTLQATDLWVVADEFDWDAGLAKVGAHAEVGDGGDQGDTGGDVMEQTMRTRPGEGQAHEDERCHGHDGANGEVPVAPTDGDGDGRNTADAIVDIESLVPGHGDGGDRCDT